MNQDVLHAIKALPLPERIALVEDIWDSIAEETSTHRLTLTQAEQAELHRRLEAHRAEPDSSVSWAQVRASLYSTQRN